MKKRIISFLILFVSSALTYTVMAQAPGCPNVNAGADASVDCTNTCVDLTASYLETGETDVYGVTSIPYAPPFPYTGLTNPISVNVDDTWSNVITLPFDFCFFGDVYDQIQVGSNGVLRFDVDPLDVGPLSNDFGFNVDIPHNIDPALGEANIFGVGHDMDPSILSSGPEIAWDITGTAPCRTFVLSFSSVAQYSCNNLTTTSQIVLYETTNAIEVYVENKPSCTGWNDGNAVLGIQNNPGTIAYVPPGRNTTDSPWTATNEAWRFTPDGALNYVFNWYDDTGANIGTTNTINVCPSTDTVYTAEVVYTNCNGDVTTVTDDVLVTTAVPFSVDLGTDQDLCEGDPDVFLDADISSGTASYQWALNGTDIFGETNPTYTVSSPNSGTYSVTVSDQGCNIVDDVVITFFSIPVANPVSDYDLCDDAVVDGFTEFDLSTKDTEVLGIQVGVTVFYYGTQADADADTNVLPNLFTNTVNPQTIYVRIESDGNTDCFDTTTFDLVVTSGITANQPADLNVCDDVSNDGFEIFDLNSQNAIILGGQTGVTLSYHQTQADADGDLNPLISPYTNISNTQTIYVRVEDSTNTLCYITTTFDIIVNPLPIIVQPTSLVLCDDDYYGAADGVQVFDLTVKDTEITSGDSSLTVSYYETNGDAQADTAAINPADAYVNTSNPQTLFLRVTDNDTGCYAFITLMIEVLPNPVPQTPTVIELCDDTATGDGVEPFDLTIREADIINGELGVSATYHETLVDAQAGTSAIPDPTMYLSTGTTQTVYVRVTNNTSGCYTIVELDLIVLPLPDVIAVPDLIACEVGTDGYYTFNLDSKTGEILNGQSPTIFAVTYHATLVEAQSGTGALVSPYTNTTINSQQIFVNITNTITGCDIATLSFYIEVEEATVANMPLNEYVICDNIGDNDGFGQFNLATQDAEVLGGQNPINYTVSYYGTQAEAEAGVNALATTYENLTNPQVLYVRVDNNATICYETTSLTIRVELLPIFALDDRYVLCVDSPGGITTIVSPPVIDTGLAANDYSFEWTDSTGIVVGTDSTFIPSSADTYMVEVTNTTTGCQNSDGTEVVQSSPPDVTAIVTTLAFAEVHVIEANAIGDGEYEFSLDGGLWQQTGTFNDVMAGEHVITARDINGCGESSTVVMIMDYPLYFTPNGDGYHDTWNIIGISNQIDAKIYIFDRYGKLLKQLSPTAIGWDGLFNGEALPSSDYWFIVNYREPIDDTKKEFKAHFTLKR